MGITERVEQMTVRVTSPSGTVTAEIHGRHEVRVSFAAGYYHQAGERELESQLAQTGRLLWAARMRAYNAIIADEYRDNLIVDPQPVSQRDYEFYERRDNTVAEGQSPDGRISVSVRGMRDWTVKVAAGTVQTLSEYEFTSGASVAARRLIADQQDKIRELKVEIYSPEFVADFAGQAK